MKYTKRNIHEMYEERKLMKKLYSIPVLTVCYYHFTYEFQSESTLYTLYTLSLSLQLG